MGRQRKRSHRTTVRCTAAAAAVHGAHTLCHSASSEETPYRVPPFAQGFVERLAAELNQALALQQQSRLPEQLRVGQGYQTGKTPTQLALSTLRAVDVGAGGGGEEEEV